MERYSYFIISLLLIFLGFSSCQKDVEQGGSLNSIKGGDIIYQSRRLPIPKVPESYLRKDKARALSADAPNLRLSPYNTLGQVHAVGNGIIGHPENIGNDGVFDIESILNDRITSKYLFNRDLDMTQSYLYIYNSIDSLRNVTNNTNKITSGFKLNLVLFSIGKEITYSKIFNSNISREQTHIWGEYDLLYKAKRIGLETTDASLKTIAYRNINDQFLHSIFSFPISDYIRKKGFLVVTDMYTGGRLSAKFDFYSETNKRLEINGKAVRDSIWAAFGWNRGEDDKNINPLKADQNLSMSIGYGKGNGNYSNQGNTGTKFLGVFTSIGGAKDKQIPSTVVDLKNNSINIGGWYASLADPKEHKYIDVYDGGLVSIDKFILESNFKERIEGTLSGLYKDKEALDIPYLEIRNIASDVYYKMDKYTAMVDVSEAAGVILHTRQGDKVLFMNKDFQARLPKIKQPYNDAEIRERYTRDNEALVRRLKSIFSCDIKSDNPHHWLLGRSDVEERRELWVRFRFSFDSTKIYKYRNPKTGVWYIYDKESRSAMSYYDNLIEDDDDTYITDMYGITDWVDSLEEKKISMQELSMYYNIIGL